MGALSGLSGLTGLALVVIFTEHTLLDDVGDTLVDDAGNALTGLCL
jgi:hypothetical protein